METEGRQGAASCNDTSDSHVYILHTHTGPLALPPPPPHHCLRKCTQCSVQTCLIFTSTNAFLLVFCQIIIFLSRVTFSPNFLNSPDIFYIFYQAKLKVHAKDARKLHFSGPTALTVRLPRVQGIGTSGFEVVLLF